jgi:hypothetical protein
MLYVKEFPSAKELEFFLQGKLLGEKIFPALKGINVRGLTLTFTTPAITITFPNTAAFEYAKPAEIQTEAESQSSGRLFVVKPPAGRAGDIRFGLLTNGDVFTGGTAASVLGLVAGTVGAAAIALADVAQVYYISKSAQYGLVFDA